MSKRFLAVAAFAALLVPSTSHAVDHSKQWALGYYDPQAPVGVRYQFSPKAAFDVGLGFASSEDVDNASTTPGETKNFLQYHVEVGVPLTVVKTERADFFVRPGLLWRSIPYQYDDGVNPVSDERAADLNFKLHLGAEWHATDNLSLSVGHGVNIASSKGVSRGELVSSPAKPESSTSWGSEALDVTSIGFHWYFD